MFKLEAGDRVETPKGPGTIIYRRMAPPDYIEAEAYSVRLDDRRSDPNYIATSFSAKDVRKAT